jgi:trigger factor
VTEFTLAFPEPQESAGEPARLATFRVTVRELSKKELPSLDDEFAKDHGECDTLEELREKVSRNLQQAIDRRADNQLEEEVISHLLDKNPFEMPPSLLREQELRMLLDAGILRSGGDPAAAEAALPEAVREEFHTRALHQVQTVLLLDALAKQLDLSISEGELNERIAEFIAANDTGRRQQIEAFYSRHENRHALERRLLHEKALRFVIDKASIKVVERGGAEQAARGVAGEEEKD